MPRTPLFRILRRSLDLARVQAQTGEPVPDLIDRLREEADTRLTRRRFLAASGALVAAAPLAGCASRHAQPSGLGVPRGGVGPGDADVTVVGAGMAGLVAAYRLEQAGVRVRVVDAANRSGGRMFSLRDRFPDGQVVELGGELIDSGHEHMRSLATELGIDLDDLQETDVDTETWFFGGTRRNEREVVGAFAPVAARIQRDLATIGGDHDVTYRTPLGAEALDRLSIAQWLDRAGVSGWFRSLIDVGYTTEYGLEIGEQSALNLLLWIDPTPDPFRIYGDSDERYHTRGGNDAFTTALAKRLSAPVETGSALEAVRRRSDGTYVCSVRRGSTSTEVASRIVLLALPFTMLRHVRIDVPLPPAKRLAIDTMGYGTNAKLMVGFTSRPWREQQRSNGSVATDLAFQSTWETSRRQAGAAGVLTNFTGGTHGSAIGEGTAAEQAARLVTDLERVFPGVTAARGTAPEVRFHWPTHPFTRGSYAAFKPGQWTSINGAAGEPVDGLFFAGEHTSVAAQGFMEGACESGQSAAREIVDALGVTARSALATAIVRRASLAGSQRGGRRANRASGYPV